MKVDIALYCGGILSAALAVFHCFFYNFFKWEDDLKKISTVNSRIFITLHIGIIAVFFFFAYLSFAYTNELSSGKGLGFIVTGFYACIWLFRTTWQLTYLKQLKNEKPFLHYGLTVWFMLLFAAYSTPFFSTLI